jgi:undecaprenyl-diphosphatase
MNAISTEAGLAGRRTQPALPPSSAAGRRKRLATLRPRFQERETDLCLACNRWGRRHVVRAFFAAVSRLGDGGFWYALMVFIVLFGGARGLPASAHMAATGVVALALYRGLKRWTRRPRPFAADRRIFALARPLDEFSFPSGHTLHAVAFSLVALAWYPILAWVLIPFSAGVAASRVVLGLHYPSDVLAATGIGLALGGLSLWIGSAVLAYG